MMATAAQAELTTLGAMKAARRWLLWREVPEPGKKARKVPHYVTGRERQGKLDTDADRAALGSFADACRALEGRPADWHLGFALGPEGDLVWQGVDLDDIEAKGLGDLIATLPGYVERSPSGAGVHAIGRGRTFRSLGSNRTGIEAYAAGRFFTFTGDVIRDAEPTCIADFVETTLAPRHKPAKPDRAAAPRIANDDDDRVLSLLYSRGNDLDRSDWVRLALALKAGLGERARDAWLAFSARYAGAGGITSGEAERVWETAAPDGQVGIGTAVHLLGGFEQRAPSLRQSAERAGSVDPLPVDEARAPAFSDEALALRFAEIHANDLRFVSPWGKWLSWSGTHWKMDDTLFAFDLARAVCREAAARANKSSVASVIASAKTIAAVERLAKADRRLAATVDQWDADIWALNTPAGTVDLHTGAIRPHRPGDHITRSAAVSPGGECPLWLAHLDRVTAGDAELQGFIKRTLGYALTGSTVAHALFFLFGTGANGKSVVIDTVAAILGDYHKTAPIETFTASSTERHPTDLAMLRGARLVTAVETEEGRRWAESRIKTLTGGDRISARFMRQDFFEFAPQFKLLIAGNHKPGLRSVDEAIRRRFHLVPFTVTIPPAERIEGFSDRLKPEWPGILAWMIEGCLEWQRVGLQPPAAVTAATAAYLDAQDALSAWIEERCDRTPSGFESRTALFESWSKWANAAGEFVGPRSRFLDALELRGFEPGKRGVMGFRGIALKQHDYSDAHWNR